MKILALCLHVFVQPVTDEIASLRQAVRAAEQRTSDAESASEERALDLEVQLTSTQHQLSSTQRQMTTATQKAEAAERALRDDVDRLHDKLRAARERTRTAEADAAESRRVLHQALDSREAGTARSTPSSAAERPREAQAEAPKPVSEVFCDDFLSYPAEFITVCLWCGSGVVIPKKTSGTALACYLAVST